MKIVKFKAGLGNQMFQYAFLRYLQEIYKIDCVKVDSTYYSSDKYHKYWDFGILQFNVSFAEATLDEVRKYKPLTAVIMPGTMQYRVLSKIEYTLNKKCYFEKNRSYVDISNYLNREYFDGYWQSWKYLDSMRDILLKEFQPRKSLSNKSTAFIEKYYRLNTVFVGVRRGDYLSNKYAKNHFGECSLDYYCNAVNYMCSRLKHPIFIFFSNDIGWVKKNLNAETLGLEKNQIVYRLDEDVYSDFEELFVMSYCKNAIISNSTFNFWGAWMIEDKSKIIVAPKQWFKDGSPIDIIPNTWIKM